MQLFSILCPANFLRPSGDAGSLAKRDSATLGVAFRQLSETAFRTDLLAPQPPRQASVMSGRALRLTPGGEVIVAAGTCLRTDRTVTVIARG